MKHDYNNMDQWLQDRMEEDLTAMTEERERLLTESGKFQDIEMPMDRLQEIHREIERQKHAAYGIRIRRRMILAVAAVMVSCIGLGLVGSGSKLYRPEVVEREVGDETSTKVNNSDAKEREYDEEEVCQQISEELGVIPVRFSYRPEGIYLYEYWVKKDEKSALLSYEINERKLYTYISKDFKETAIYNRSDGEKTDTIEIISCGLEVEVLEYQDLEGEVHYTVSFEYLNTYYSFVGVMEKDEFIKILENIWIKNV